MLRLAEKAFCAGAASRSRSCTWTPGTTSRGARLPRPPGRGAGRAADRRQRAGGDRRRPGAASRRTASATGSRPRCCSTRWRSTGSTRCSAAPGGTRRRPGPRSGCSPSATSSASGTRRTSAPSCGRSTTAGIHPGESIRVFPLSNWTELDIWHYIARERLDAAVDLLRARPRGVRPRRHALRGERVPARRATVSSRSARRCATAPSATPTCTAAVASDARHGREGDRGGRRDPDHRARRHPGRRPVQRGRDGRPQAGGLLLMRCDTGDRPSARPMDMLRFATAGSVDDGKSHPDRPAALRHQVDLRPTSSRRSRRSARRAATSTPTWRCSPTACGPSGSRASRSTWRTATSPRRGASSSSPTPRGTSSTPATWSPAPPPPTWR